MAYYDDLSEYVYAPTETPMVNVGWLAAGHFFPRAKASRLFVADLLFLADRQQNIMRGVHDCEFCDQESPLRMTAPVERGWVSLGMGEIHVAGREGRVYAAPSLIVHYVDAHGYEPPADFVEAVELAAEAYRS